FGLAIDIGTTTVSALLVDLKTGHALAKATTGNGQIRYGADVINRIIQQQKPGGIKTLQQAIIKDTLLPLIKSLCKATSIIQSEISKMTIASNTTMNHLLLGIDANSIRIEPYEPAMLEFESYDPHDIGITLSWNAKLILAPNIGSYVGGDITAGVLSIVTPSGDKMWKRAEMTLFIDLGTNGEIVFGNNEFLMACACSAGPAFEGGDISCGMRAMDGAIEACKIDKNTMEPTLTVIGGSKPKGLCGSGLIDVVAELFRTGIINGKGKFNFAHTDDDRCGQRLRYDEYGVGSFTLVFAAQSATNKDISISEVDIDNFIRAKGAIFSGIMSLLTPLGFTPADIDDVMIAGGIGSGINIKNAISIGMLPDLPKEKYSYVGNSSLGGAYEMLISQKAEEHVIEIARNMTYIELSSQPGYMDEFIAACFLPHTDETLFPTAIRR
ncbi:MAG: ASKHA domain-containing protein, partial [Oscillospiraceae bacterium]|nr:ASKHA domain-containing protein [Oscillospiraceae bacterium]